MEDWAFWQKVVIVMLTVIVVALGYRQVLRWIGGSSRFDNQFAFLFPLERDDLNKLKIRFELPVADVVTLVILDEDANEVGRVVNNEKLAAGTHSYEVDTNTWSKQQYTLQLKSGNQQIERIFESA